MNGQVQREAEVFDSALLKQLGFRLVHHTRNLDQPVFQHARPRPNSQGMRRSCPGEHGPVNTRPDFKSSPRSEPTNSGSSGLQPPAAGTDFSPTNFTPARKFSPLTWIPATGTFIDDHGQRAAEPRSHLLSYLRASQVRYASAPRTLEIQGGEAGGCAGPACLVVFSILIP